MLLRCTSGGRQRKVTTESSDYSTGGGWRGADEERDILHVEGQCAYG